jgi:hypothetical protein
VSEAGLEPLLRSQGATLRHVCAECRINPHAMTKSLAWSNQDRILERVLFGVNRANTANHETG